MNNSSPSVKTIDLSLSAKEHSELTTLFDAAARLIGLRSVATITKYNQRIAEGIKALTNPEDPEARIELRVSETECNELYGVFDAAIKSAGASAVPLVHNFAERIKQGLESAIIPASANALPPSRRK